MQTVLQELIDHISNCQNDNFISDIEYLKEKAIEFLEKEKQQIIDAVEWNNKSNMGEVYYKSKFKNK